MPVETIKLHAKMTHHVETQGDLLAVHVYAGTRGRKPGKRKDVGWFSRGSRKRMMTMVNRLNWHTNVRSTFGTTTWVDSLGRPTYKRLTAFRDWLHKDLCAHIGRPIGAIWRVEWKDRLKGEFIGQIMPHIHWLYWDVPWIEGAWYSAKCAQCMGAGEVDTELGEIRNKKGCMKYLNKHLAYVSKLHCSLDSVSYLDNFKPGRQWGVLRPEQLPFAEKAEWFLNAGEQTERIRTIGQKHWPKMDGDPYQGFTVFGGAGREVEQFLRTDLDDINVCPLESMYSPGGPEPDPPKDGDE